MKGINFWFLEILGSLLNWVFVSFFLVCLDCVIFMDFELEDGRFGFVVDFLFFFDDKKFISFGFINW